jgi:phosphatidylserine/phosphatidylglycerophosphate/cardiolipin synthase-like enzyme
MPRPGPSKAASGLSPLLALVVVFGVLLFAAGYFVAKGKIPSLQGTAPSAPSAPVSGGTLRCYFSPRGGCTDAVVEALNAAKTSVHVQAYSFTSKPIAQALVAAHRRGVKVIAVLDKSQRSAKYTEGDFLAHAGIPTYIDDQHAIAHNKIMLIDGTTLITGSFNFTNAAEKSNAENLLVVQNVPAIDQAYEQNFQKHLGHSEIYPGR